MGQNVDRAGNRSATEKAEAAKAIADAQTKATASLGPAGLAKLQSGELMLDHYNGDFRALYSKNPNGTLNVYDANGKFLLTKEPPGGGWMGDVGNALGGILKPVENTVNAIAKDPLPTLITMALVAAGVPAPIASGITSAAGGAPIDKVLESAALSYAGGEAGKAASSWTAAQVGDSIGKAGTSIASSAAGGAASAATKAGLMGGNILEAGLSGGLSAGTTAGLKAGARSLGESIDRQFGTSVRPAELAQTTGWSGSSIGQNVNSAINFALNPVGSLAEMADSAIGTKENGWGDMFGGSSSFGDALNGGLSASKNIAIANRQATRRNGPQSVETGGIAGGDFSFTPQGVATSLNFASGEMGALPNMEMLLGLDNAGTQTAGQKAAAGGKSGSTDKADPNKLLTVVGGRYSGDSAQGFSNFAQSSNDNQWSGFYG